MVMDLIRYANVIAEDFSPTDDFPTADEVAAVMKRYLNRREALGDLHEIRNKLLAGARRLLNNTIRLKRVLDEPDALAALTKLTKTVKVKGYWASKLISVPLLKSAIDQLASASTAPQIALGISRIMGLVEDHEEAVSGPYKPRIQGGEVYYHQVYKYLAKIAGWTPERLADFDATMATFRDTLVKQIVGRVAASKKNFKMARPAGW
jgi:hypothetical protein